MDKNGFINYMESKDLAPMTQKEYLKKAQLFFNWIKKEDIQITKTDILDFLEYLKNKKHNANATRAVILIAIRIYFSYLFENELITNNPAALLKIRGTKTQKLWHLYTSDDLDELYDSFYHIYIRNYQPSKYSGKASVEYIKLKRARNHIVIGILLYQGVITSELKNIRLNDIDLQKGTIKITANHHGKDRILPLKATQIGVLINYIQNTKPKLEELYKTSDYEEFLFSVENQNFDDVIKRVRDNLRSIDRNFVNFRQIRTSVITHWLKVGNLRSAQYQAGHRSIISTERYLPNNLENLIDEITKFHPFN